MNSLEDAKDYLRENWEKGAICPCCTQRVQLYRHKINAQIAKCLIDMYNLDEEWVHVLQELKPSNRMYSLARFWGLIIPSDKVPTTDKKTSGYWHLTERGQAFVRGDIAVAKYAYIFNDKVYKFSPEHITIQEALGSKFNYSELLQR